MFQTNELHTMRPNEPNELVNLPVYLAGRANYAGDAIQSHLHADVVSLIISTVPVEIQLHTS